MVALGNEHHARCDYCGSTKGTDWRGGEYKIYCSADCQRAAGILPWSCLLIISGSLSVYAWATFGLTYSVLPLIACTLFALFSLTLVIRGIQARARVDQRHQRYQS